MEEKNINFLPPEDQNEPISEVPEYQPAKKSTKWRVWFILSAIVFLLAVFWTAKSIFVAEVPNDPNAYDPTTLEPKSPDGLFKKMTNLIFKSKYEIKGYDNDRINILLFGIGGAGHDGPYLTDTIIIASIKPSTGQVALISIPRDLSITIPGHGVNKINSVSNYGMRDGKDGPTFATDLIAKTFDLDIPYHAQVDFKAFSEIVDYVGGLKVNVEKSFVDEMYPTSNEGYQTVSFQKGEQSMNGETALIYARSRHGNNNEGSDFARAKRQQKVIFALKEKMLSTETLANPIRLNKIITSLTKHIITNLQFSDIIYFIKLFRELEVKQIITAVLDNGTNGFLVPGYSPEGAYILEPKTGNLDEIKNYIKNIFENGETKPNDTPTQTAYENTKTDTSDTKIEVQNGTWIVGLAARAKKSLESKGFAVETIGNSETRPQAKGGIYNLTKRDLTGTLTLLQRELMLPIGTNLPSDVKPATSTDILILLGEDTTE